MQVMIDIPDRIHWVIEKSITVNGSSASQILINAVKNGIPIPDNATNGDVMELIFNICLLDFKKMWGGGSVTDDWWNSPYKAESEG